MTNFYDPNQWIMSIFNFFKDFISKFRLNDPTSKTVFDHYFFDFKYYLQKNASCEHFAPLLNIEADVLDKISITYYGYPFNLLINEYRYKHFMEELGHPFNQNLSIESIIKLSGFDNNESFAEYMKDKH